MSQLERIVAGCGGILLDGGTRALIPGPAHSHKDRSVSLALTEEGRIIIHCFSPKDDWRNVRDLLRDRGLLGAEASVPEAGAGAWNSAIIVQPQNEDRLARARRIWEEGRAIGRTPASHYLRQRGLAMASGHQAMRFHPRMTSIDDRLRRPALLSAIIDPNGELQGVQATLLTKYGAAKAAVATPRRVIGKLVGGAVRLAEAEHELAVGEGVETMLSASAALSLPAWAALTANNLSLFTPPPQVRRLVIAADNDAAGLAAAENVRRRLSIDVTVLLPPNAADDWNALEART